MKILQSKDFYEYWKKQSTQEDDEKTEAAVKEIIEAVRKEGDEAVRRYASKFDKSSPQKLEVPLQEVKRAYEELRAKEPTLADAMELAAEHIYRFSKKQKEQFSDFEYEMEKGIVTGQRVIPVQRAAIYAPGGRFPLFSSELMGLLPAFSAGVEEVVLASPPAEDGLPYKIILAAAGVAAKITGVPLDDKNSKRFRVFAAGGAQAIAALAFGTETIPRADVIAGPGNRFVAMAKKLLYGQVGIDFIAGPSDVLIIKDGKASDTQKAADIERAAGIIAADMLAQAEHDPDARARALVPDMGFAQKIADDIEKRLASLPTVETARASIDKGGLIIVCQDKEDAVRIANTIAPEHLELQVENPQDWIPHLINYGSLFIGELSAEVLGDYSAGINHTLPTSTSARFTGGLSVRHFLKTVTTLRCESGEGFERARNAAEVMARAEGLEAHAQSAGSRK
jgi:histidinol dehydrogenase